MPKFQGVVCCCIGSDSTVSDSIFELLDLKTSSTYLDVECRDLWLANKYYECVIHLFDYDGVPVECRTDALKENCQAIILYAHCPRLTLEQLDIKLEQLDGVGGEPRILICEGISQDCEAYISIQDWCIRNNYDMLLKDDHDIKSQVIDSLSAHRWSYRHDTSANKKDGRDEQQLDDQLMKKLTDFDSLLSKMRVYRDQPELRGLPDDKNIEEIATLLSGLLGDDVDNFLANQEQDQNS